LYLYVQTVNVINMENFYLCLIKRLLLPVSVVANGVIDGEINCVSSVQNYQMMAHNEMATSLNNIAAITLTSQTSTCDINHVTI